MPALDGVATGGGTGTPIVTSGNLTCSNTNNVICVAVLNNGAAVSGVTGGGVTFTSRAIVGTLTELEFWTGFSTAAFNDVVSVAIPGGSSFAHVTAFGMHGPPSSSYFDVNGSLPATGGSDPLSLSTTAAHTIILGMYRFASTASPTEGSGFTIIDGSGFMLVEYLEAVTAQTSLSITVGTGAGNANGGIGDALVFAAAGGSVIKTFGGLANASTKQVLAVTNASVKTFDGVSNV